MWMGRCNHSDLSILWVSPTFFTPFPFHRRGPWRPSPFASGFLRLCLWNLEKDTWKTTVLAAPPATSVTVTSVGSLRRTELGLTWAFPTSYRWNCSRVTSRAYTQGTAFRQLRLWTVEKCWRPPWLLDLPLVAVLWSTPGTSLHLDEQPVPPRPRRGAHSLPSPRMSSSPAQ